MLVGVSPSALKDGRWYEHLIRFALGGAATVFAGWVASRFGPSIGGLFLALPAIFCASATLIEKHQMRRKHEAGKEGRRRGREAAALDAAGAAVGSLGLIGFAASFHFVISRSTIGAFLTASLVWVIVSIAGWWTWRSFRVACRVAAIASEHVHSSSRDA